MPRLADPDTARIITAHLSADAQIRDQVRRYLRAAWLSLGSYRDADVARLERAVVPVVLGGQRQVSALTAAYLARLAQHTLGGVFRPVPVSPAVVSGAALRGGVDPSVVYHRPAVTVWRALAAGKPFRQAVREGLTRLEAIASTDLQLAKTHTARQVFAGDERVVGHRRVLTGAENCALCVVASTQRYHRGDLQPIHSNCDCGVEPIYGTADPGQVIDPDRLDEVHDAVAERFGVDAVDRSASADEYRRLLAIETHGEIGPVLTVKGHNFTGPDGI